MNTSERAGEACAFKVFHQLAVKLMEKSIFLAVLFFLPDITIGEVNAVSAMTSRVLLRSIL